MSQIEEAVKYINTRFGDNHTIPVEVQKYILDKEQHYKKRIALGKDMTNWYLDDIFNLGSDNTPSCVICPLISRQTNTLRVFIRAVFVRHINLNIPELITRKIIRSVCDRVIGYIYQFLVVAYHSMCLPEYMTCEQYTLYHMENRVHSPISSDSKDTELNGMVSILGPNNQEV